MLLDRPGQGVQVTCADVARQRRPLGEGVLGGGDGGVHLGGPRLGHVRQVLAGGRVEDLEGPAVQGLRPAPVDEVLEPSFVLLDPLHGFCFTLRRGPVLQGLENCFDHRLDS
ncbi:hypothetical protein D3C87_1741180 [compost metagenome]